MQTTAPSPLAISSLARDLDRLAAWNPTAATEIRRAANARYLARTLDCAVLAQEVREITSANRYTDAYLTVEAAEKVGGRPTGYARAASYLLTIPEHARAAVADDANLRTNLSGGRYADNVQGSCLNWQSIATPRAAFLRDLSAFTGQPEKQAKVREAAAAEGVFFL